MSELLTFNSLVAFAALAALEIVLGIDNLVFIAILSGKMPASWRPLARRLGLALAAVGRIVLVFAIIWIVTLESAGLFTLFGQHISIKDLILIVGGLFLVGKATWEIHENLEGPERSYTRAREGEHDETDRSPGGSVKTGLALVLLQIMALDLVFSIDSVLTAIGIVKPGDYHSAHFPFTSIPWVPLAIIVAAILVSIGVMLFFIGPLSRFVERHPTIKMLALSFLVMIGVVLIAEGCHQHIPRGYIYAAMVFSLVVELLNLKFTKRRAARTSGEG